MARDNVEAKVVNLTAFPTNKEQLADGIIDVANREELSDMLVFEGIPTADDIDARANAIADIAKENGATAAMISGAPYLMPALEAACRERGIKPMYAFSQRDSVEKPKPDGTIEKVTVFRYEGLYEAAEHRTDDGTPQTSGNSEAIMNLTQHPATAEQRSDGIVEPENKADIGALLTFVGKPEANALADRAEKIADVASNAGCTKAMIGGMPALMGPLEDALRARGVTPVYAFSEKKVERLPDGRMKSTFEYKGLVETPDRGGYDRDEDKATNDEDDDAIGVGDNDEIDGDDDDVAFGSVE